MLIVFYAHTNNNCECLQLVHMFYALFFLSNEVEHDNLISVLILSLGMKSKSATIHSKKSSCSGVIIDVVKSVFVS